MPSTSRPTNTYPVLKTLLTIVLLIREEGANPRASLTEDRDTEGNLNFVIWIDEIIVVDGLEHNSKLDQFLSAE